MEKILFGIIVTTIFTGCVSDTLTITKCKEYKNGICIVSKTIEIKKCNEPTKINNNIYCIKK